MSMGSSYDEFVTDFLLIKNNEDQTEIGKCWKNGSYAKGNSSNELNKISEMLNRYL